MTGAVAASYGCVFGDVVNVAARILGKAGEGDILLSPELYELVRRAPDLQLEQKSAGVLLKGRKDRVALYRARGEEVAPAAVLPVASPPSAAAPSLLPATKIEPAVAVAVEHGFTPAPGTTSKPRFVLPPELGRGLTVGRDPVGAEITFEHPQVSRRHARLLLTAAGHVEVEDLSTNGTFLNDKQIKTATLRHGDVLRFGPEGPTLRYESRRAGAAARPKKRLRRARPPSGGGRWPPPDRRRPRQRSEPRPGTRRTGCWRRVPGPAC